MSEGKVFSIEDAMPTSSLTVKPSEIESLSAQSVSIREIKHQVAAIKQLQQDVMIKNVHYGVVPGCGDKPALLKAGAEKLALTFRIASDVVVEDLSREGNIRYRVNCRGTSIITGKFLGSGVGECSSDEDKYKWKKTYINEYNQTDEKNRRKIIRYNKTTKQNYEEFQVRQNPSNVANTVLKMAKKRAFVDLILTITGASDMFAQDIEDMEEFESPVEKTEDQQDEQKKENLPPAEKNPPAESPPLPEKEITGDVISIPQGKRLYAIAKNAGKTDEQLHELIKEYGYEHTKDIEWRKYNEICAKAAIRTETKLAQPKADDLPPF